MQYGDVCAERRVVRYDCAVGSTLKRFRLAVKHTRVKSKYTASCVMIHLRRVPIGTCSASVWRRAAGRALEPRAALVQHVRFRAAQVQHVLGRGGAAFRGLRDCLCACNEIRSWAVLGKNRSRNRTTRHPVRVFHRGTRLRRARARVCVSSARLSASPTSWRRTTPQPRSLPLSSSS